MPVEIGAIVTWLNNDDRLHTVISGSDTDENRGLEFNLNNLCRKNIWALLYYFRRGSLFLYPSSNMAGKAIVSWAIIGSLIPMSFF